MPHYDLEATVRLKDGAIKTKRGGAAADNPKTAIDHFRQLLAMQGYEVLNVSMVISEDPAP